MLCAKCGGNCLPDSKFCPSCGAQLTTVEKEIVLPQPLALPLFIEPTQPVPAPQPMRCPSVAQPAPAKKGSLLVPVTILAILCVLGLVLFALFPGDGSDASPSDNTPTSCFEVEDGFLYFNRSLYTGSPELTVPETVNGETVLYLSANCFCNYDSITTVFLPDTLENIGNHAFSGCDQLRGISIPEGVISIASSAFADCDALEAITIPSTIKYLAEDAFDGCIGLRYVFFSGTMEEWSDLFEGRLHPKTTVYCSDGEIRGPQAS